MKKYKIYNHATTKIMYHLIFSTKYRRNLLNPIKNEVFNAMKLAEMQNNNFSIEIMEIDKCHMHFMLSIKPSETISNVVKCLKQVSTYYIWKNNHEYMSKFYYKQHHLWTRGYFVSTIGDCGYDKLYEYIKNQ